MNRSELEAMIEELVQKIARLDETIALCEANKAHAQAELDFLMDEISPF
jgi:hypothetical protein